MKAFAIRGSFIMGSSGAREFIRGSETAREYIHDIESTGEHFGSDTI